MTKTLKQNIINLGTLGTSPKRAESDDNQHHYQSLSTNVQYACPYLFEYLSLAGQDPLDLYNDDNQVNQFFQEHLLHWLEIMSPMRKISERVFIITRFESMLKVGTFSMMLLRN